jgi:hypothetical protein
VRWQTAYLSAPVAEQSLAYWDKQLAGEIPALNLPTDRLRPPVQTYKGAVETIKLKTELTKSLKELGEAHGATLFMTLMAAFQVLLYRYAGREDFVIGTTSAGRSQTDLNGIVGYFVNPLVIRADLSGKPTFTQLLARIRGTVLDAFAHSEIPFPLLVERLQPERDPQPFTDF